MTSRALTKLCGAETAGGRCTRRKLKNRSRCARHGGLATGPRTAAGRKRVGDAARRRYIEGAIEEGWAVATEAMRAEVADLLSELRNSQNATAIELGLSRSGVRRVLAGLPLRPDEFALLERRLPEFSAVDHERMG